MKLRAWLIRMLGMKHCGAFGGIAHGFQRWCIKPFGHSDSCYYEMFQDKAEAQPGVWVRAQVRGW
jgi:hypothetical protein